MEKLALTCKILYDLELLEIKKELRKYKKTYDYPQIRIDISWFERLWNTESILYVNDQVILNNVEKLLKIMYEKDFDKHKLFFKNQIEQLKQTIEIFNNEDNKFEYTWIFLNSLFEKINWINCNHCEKLVRSSRGLCNVCDAIDIYQDNQDALADAIDH